MMKCVQCVLYVLWWKEFQRVKMGAEKCTLCEKLKGPDFLTDTKLQDLLQDVLPLGFLHDTHSFQLSVCQSHQSPP